MAKSRYSAFFGEIKKSGQDYRQVVLDYTRGATSSLNALDDEELRQLTAKLRTANGARRGPSAAQVRPKQDPRCRQMISKIFARGIEMGHCPIVPGQYNQNGKPKRDYSRVTDWVVKYGYLHKPLNDYKYEEMHKLVTQYERRYEDWLKGLK